MIRSPTGNVPPAFHVESDAEVFPWQRTLRTRCKRGDVAGTAGEMAKRQGYGWAPYWAPFLAFMLLVEIGRRMPEGPAALILVLKALVPGGVVMWYATRVVYP